jgi:4-amino-4-deoxy-L-arabinose transferase-like glycosyltransferase
MSKLSFISSEAAIFKLIALLLILPFLLRLTLIYFEVIPHTILGYDWELYEQLSYSLLSGNGMSITGLNGEHYPTFIRPPLYPIFLAILHKTFGDGIWVSQVANAVISFGTMLLTALICKPYGRLVTIIAILILSLNPMFFLSSFTSMTETICAFLIILSLYLYLISDRSESNIYLFLAGVVIGLAIITRINFAVIAGVIFIISLFKNRRKAIFFIFGALIVTSPWLIRNAIHNYYGASTTLGINLTVFALNNGMLTPAEINKQLAPDIDLLQYNKSLDNVRGAASIWRPFHNHSYQNDSGLSEIDVDQKFVNIGAQAMQKNIGLTIIGVAKNIWNFMINYFDRNVGILKYIYYAYSLVIFLLAIYAISFGVRKIDALSVAAIGYLMAPIIAMAFVTFIYHRYRIPFSPVISILAAIGVKELIDRNTQIFRHTNIEAGLPNIG